MEDNGGFQILKFSGEWCQPCKLLAKTLDNLGISATEVDIDKEPELAAKYRVRGVPTLVAIRENLECGRLVGNKPANEITTWLDEVQAVHW